MSSRNPSFGAWKEDVEGGNEQLGETLPLPPVPIPPAGGTQRLPSADPGAELWGKLNVPHPAASGAGSGKIEDMMTYKN